jgi:hypothetical protein
MVNEDAALLNRRVTHMTPAALFSRRLQRVDVRQYDRALAGADYVCKCLGANAYELNKYSFANTVTLSASVIRLIAGIDASGDRRCCQDT